MKRLYAGAIFFLLLAPALAQPTPQSNYLQNSGMQLAMRQGASSIVWPNFQGGDITVDRWRYDYGGSSQGRFQQVADAPTGLLNSIKFTVSNAQSSPLGANDVVSFFQSIEGQQMASLAWGTSAASDLSCGWWAKWHQTGQHGGVVKNFNGTRTWAFSYTVATADVWAYYTTTVTGDTSGQWNSAPGTRWGFFLLNIASGSNLQISPGVWTVQQAANATGSVNGVDSTSNTAQFTGITCVAGSTAPTATQSILMMRPASDELPLTQRYYQKLIDPPLSGGTLTGGTLCAHMKMLLSIPMMTAPTTIAMTGHLLVSDGPNVDTLNAITIDKSTSTVIDIIANTVTGGVLVAGRPCYVYQSSTSNNFLELFAEP